MSCAWGWGGLIFVLWIPRRPDLFLPFRILSSKLENARSRTSQILSGRVVLSQQAKSSPRERTVPSSPPHSSAQRKQIPSILSRGSSTEEESPPSRSHLNATLEPQGGAGTVLRVRTPLCTLKSVIPLPGLSFFINYMGLKEETFL